MDSYHKFVDGMEHFPRAKPDESGMYAGRQELKRYASVNKSGGLYFSALVARTLMKGMSKFVEVYWQSHEKCIVLVPQNNKTETSRTINFGSPSQGASLHMERFLRMSGAGEYVRLTPYNKFLITRVESMIVIDLKVEVV